MTSPVSSATEPSRQVPTFSANELRPRAGKYCIAIFVINEGEKIRKQLKRMEPYMGLADVLIADGGSTDGSLAPEYLRECGVRTLLVKTGPGKLGAQMRMAFAYAMDQGYEGVITIDGNNKDDPAALPAFVTALENGADHVQGSRFITGGRAVRTPPGRLVGIRLLHAPLISLAAGFRYTDTTNGFRAYSRRFLLDERVAPFRDVFSRYELHYYLAIRAARLGFTVRELPVTREYPATGPTPTKISPIRGNFLVLRTLLAACLHRFDPVRTDSANAARHP
ncbi:MAG: glycosyltransferase family 2 protein [Gemmatimonadota bacterium]